MADHITARSALPRYVSIFISRGKPRLRYRRGGLSRYFAAAPGSAAFWSEYAGFQAEYERMTQQAAPRRRIVPGSVDDLLRRFYVSMDFGGRKQPVSAAKARAVLDRYASAHGHRMVAEARFYHIDAILQAAAIRQSDGTGGPFAAHQLKRQLRMLFRYAVKLGWITINPVDHVAYRTPESAGFAQWSDAEIRQYQAHWPLGTMPRLALEMALWTARRRSDLCALGPHNLQGDLLRGVDAKTGKAWAMPVAADLRAALDAMGPDHAQRPRFLVTSQGAPYSVKGFGAAFRSWAEAAGLHQRTVHGLRKSMLRRLAESGASQQMIKSVSNHASDALVAHYIAAANQADLADAAISSIERKLSHTAR